MQTLKKKKALTRSERKKHFSQMVPEEKVKVVKKLNEVPVDSWKVSEHCMDMLYERNIYAFRKDILEILNHYELIEYKIIDDIHYGKTYERVVIRDLNNTTGNYQLNAVFDITDNIIVSAWVNHKHDRHQRLREELYDAELQIL